MKQSYYIILIVLAVFLFGAVFVMPGWHEDVFPRPVTQNTSEQDTNSSGTSSVVALNNEQELRSSSSPQQASSSLLTSNTKKEKDLPVAKEETAHEVVAPKALAPSVLTPGALYVEKVVTPSAVVPAQEETPPPSTSSSGSLHQQGILVIVNIERDKEGLSPLTLNSTLSVIAEVKALDMINHQYFAHVAPDGTDIADLAARYGYEYLSIGENLAMGDFVSNADVMDGWMNSPGHRANILNNDYTEIGISAVRGMYEGRLVWYAVQEFGRPASLCPKPPELLAKKIAIYEEQIDKLEETLSALLEEINAGGIDRATYNAKVKDYNTIVDLYNDLIVMAKEAVREYNDAAAKYNTCIGS